MGIRDGNVVNKAAIDYWDFDQNGIAQVQQEPHILKKGDIVKTICYYETDNVTMYGMGSQDEMCQSSAYYYPRQKKNLMVVDLLVGLSSLDHVQAPLRRKCWTLQVTLIDLLHSLNHRFLLQ